MERIVFENQSPLNQLKMYNCDWCKWLEQDQVGSGWETYKGRPQQRGFNIFSTYFYRYALPFLKDAGKMALHHGKDWMQEILENNQPPKKALKRQLVKAARKAVMKGFDDLEDSMQKGSGHQYRPSIPAITRKIPYMGPSFESNKRKAGTKFESNTERCRFPKKKRRNLEELSHRLSNMVDIFSV